MWNSILLPKWKRKRKWHTDDETHRVTIKIFLARVITFQSIMITPFCRLCDLKEPINRKHLHRCKSLHGTDSEIARYLLARELFEVIIYVSFSCSLFVITVLFLHCSPPLEIKKYLKGFKSEKKIRGKKAFQSLYLCYYYKRSLPPSILYYHLL